MSNEHKKLMIQNILDGNEDVLAKIKELNLSDEELALIIKDILHNSNNKQKKL